MSPRKMSRKTAKAKADKLFGQIVRGRGHCEAAGQANRQCSPKLETCHIVTRARSNTRCVEANALCMCSSHHRYFTANPVEWGLFIVDRFGEDEYRRVHELSLSTGKVDWHAEVERLTAVLAGAS